jgi:hypothetical protein
MGSIRHFVQTAQRSQVPTCQLRQQLPVLSESNCDAIVAEVENQETKENHGVERGEVNIEALGGESEERTDLAIPVLCALAPMPPSMEQSWDPRSSQTEKSLQNYASGRGRHTISATGAGTI